MESPFLSNRPFVSDSGRTDRRLLYNDKVSSHSPSNKPASHGLKLRKRTSSTFNSMVALFFAAVVITLYISNIIAVNRLAGEVSELRQKYEALLNGNEILRAEVNRRSSLERIGKFAVEQLGMRYAKEQPRVLEVDEMLLEDRDSERKQ
jgi:cell division protein FtsL